MSFHVNCLPEDSHKMSCHICSEQSCLKKIKILTIVVVTGALRVNHCASVVSNKMDNMGHHKVIHYLSHKGQYSRRSRNTWWFHYDMLNKCTVEFSRENLEDNPIQEDQSPLSHKRPLQGSCSIIVDRRAQCYIAARCQLLGSQSSLDLIRNGFSTTCQGRMTTWVSLAICDHR